METYLIKLKDYLKVYNIAGIFYWYSLGTGIHIYMHIYICAYYDASPYPHTLLNVCIYFSCNLLSTYDFFNSAIL